MKIKLKQENQTSTCKCDNLGRCPHQKAQGGYSYNTLAIWMGIKPMPTRHIGRGLTKNR
jgi:hypothetical protein